MTPEQRRTVLQMALLPGVPRRLDPDRFSEVTGIDSPRLWALDELKEAIENEMEDDVEIAMHAGAEFGMDQDWVEPLIAVLDATWTHSHEDAADALGWLSDPRAVPALVRATSWVPTYLEYDEGRSLAVKAIHSLGRIPGPVAAIALDDLRNHEDRPLRECVERVIGRRASD